MAHEEALVKISGTAGADLSAKRFHAVKLNSSGKMVLAGDGERCTGVLQDGAANGRQVIVGVGGVTKMACGGVIAPGGAVSVDANGKAKAAVLGRTNTSDAGAAADPLLGSYVLGEYVGESDSAAGDIISVLITHAGVVATTAA